MSHVKRAAELSVAEIAKVLDENERLKARIAWFERQLFGQSSERRAVQSLSKGEQMHLGEQFMDVTMEPPASGTTVKEHERKCRKKPTVLAEGSADSQLKFGPDVPVKEVELPNPDLVDVPADELEQVGEKVLFRLAQQASYVVLKYTQKLYKRKDTHALCPAVAPPYVIRGSSADVSFIAGMLVDKFRWHLPLHRIHQRLKDANVYLERSTLTRLVHRAGELLEPVYHALTSSVLQSKVLTVDESPTPAGRSNGKMQTGYFWALHGDQPEVYFLFSPSRARKVIDDALQGFAGTLLTDGYSAYDSYCKLTAHVVHAQCWAHTRRKFVEAEPLVPDKCRRVLALIQELYKIEDSAKLGTGALKRARAQRSAAIIDELFAYLQAENAANALLPSNPFTKALDYALSREAQLRVFLENEHVPIDTNHVERTLRGPAVGRKNWMFHVTEVGARYAAMAYSLIHSCVLVDVNPLEYLTDVLQRIDTHPALDIHLLTPRLWKENFAASPLRSDLAL